MRTPFEVRYFCKVCFTSIEDAKVVLEEEPDLLNSRDSLGETPLHFLAVENCLPAVGWLIEMGAEVNVASYYGHTPLSDAASLKLVDMVRLLLSHGAALNSTKEREPTLHGAVRGGNLEIVSLLLAAGADVRATDFLRESALHQAGYKGYANLIPLLISAGANVNHLNGFRQTALHRAAESDDNYETVIELLKAGADPGIADVKGRTPLDVAVQDKAWKNIEVLKAQ